MRMGLSRRGILLASLLVVSASVQGCASLEEMGRQQDQYNRNRCHDQYGLVPGSSEYARCVSMGANAYADAQKNPPPPAAGAVIIAPGVVIPTGQPQNNSCTAPSSPKGQCSSCEVSCGAKQASCTAGTEWPDGSGCIKSATCECH
jgi:hypothetical protein